MEASGKKLAAMSYMMVTRKVAYKVTIEKWYMIVI